MQSEWELYARAGEAAEDILRSVYGVEIRKALNPLKLRDFEKIVRSLATSLKGQVVPVEDAALKRALGRLDAKWTDMDSEARAKLIGHAATFLGPPVVAKVLPKIDQVLAFAATDIVPATKRNAVLTYDLSISPLLNATDERIANYVRVSQGHFVRNRYGARVEKFSDTAREIVASGLERGSGSADIADRLYAELGTHVERGLAYWNTIAMVFSNRARTMTQLAAYHEAGIEAYVWESVLDEATSDVCRFMHGQRFPVAHAMQRFQDVENADSPEEIKNLQPFVRIGRDGESEALFYGSGEDRHVVARVTESGVGQKDEVGSYGDAMDEDALAAAGISAPPIHANCRSTIIPESGSVGEDRIVPVAPVPGPVPPPVIPPTAGARRAQALEDLEALPLIDGRSDVSALFVKGFNDDAPFLRHPMFVDPAGGAMGAHWQENVSTTRTQLDELVATSPTIDKAVTEKLLQKPKALTDAPKPKVVQYRGNLYLLDGHEQVAAQKLLGRKSVSCEFVNLDKALKPAPLVSPTVPRPEPLIPSVIVPTALPTPPATFAFVPQPPPPRLPTKPLPRLSDPIVRAKKVAVWAEKDAALLGGKTEDEQARMEIAARKKLASMKSVKGEKEKVVLPASDKKDPVTGMDADRALFEMQVNRYIPGELRAAAKLERVLVSDYEMGDDNAYRQTAVQSIRELLAHGTFRISEEGRGGPPIVVRMGDKFYPHMGGESDAQVLAARLLGLKTLEMQVVDANPALLSKIMQENAVVATIQAKRDLEHSIEVERARKEAGSRAALEQKFGSPEVKAVRAKHQPADYAMKYQELYQEAAPSLGWGRAMQERGLDFPSEHLRQLAEKFDEFHPLNEMAQRFRTFPADTTLRQYLEAHPDIEAWKARDLKIASTILAHVDGIRPHVGFNILSHDPAVGPEEQTKRQTTWFAKLTDRSVSMPDLKVGLALDGRASCNVHTITSWRDRTAYLEFKSVASTETVFHELGHAIEGADRGRGVRASAYLDARTAGEKTTSLKELFPRSRYEPQEVTRVDRWINTYIGKDYGRERVAGDGYFGPKLRQNGHDETDLVHTGTEVTSMAVQSLGESWRGALVNDEEHFLFGLGQLGGY